MTGFPKEASMTYEAILDALGPCGLSCEKCFAHADGDIRRHSLELREKLGNFGPFAKRFETLLDAPVFAKYPDFRAMLELFAFENCQGCRNENCKLFKGCGVRGCHQEKGVDFCYQCGEFPCQDTNFDENLQKRWTELNLRIRETGVEKYYEETKDTPRYL